jgi:hypothetical protein
MVDMMRLGKFGRPDALEQAYSEAREATEAAKATAGELT